MFVVDIALQLSNSDKWKMHDSIIITYYPLEEAVHLVIAEQVE